ncbi:hypothetical protein FB451DRAFT_1369963 [Mycena latifolia]|nr:hypothetical protein FB451DRAFT_1369963 [Mycena latifolia]
MFPLLPPALVALILASPAFAAPTSVNDPFKALAAQVVKPPEPPVCCLNPLSPTDSVQDDVLLSFEEWKEKRFAMQTLVQDKAKEKDAAAGERPVEGSDSTATAAEVPSSLAAPQDAPHFRVPITDRFNYASLDCSARVHTSHRSAKSPESILSSKRDRYMLSPCRPPKGEKQFVVVELCEDIRIDTVQLANFEFFSGVFKDFTVSVSKTYTTDPEGWTFASTHTAKNIRVVQSFHPPTSLRDFYRYIRIDFHSHYSNEYYCPISLLRVYGLTHLEEYKWDMWETESRARARRDEQLTTPLEVKEPEPAPAPTPDPISMPASYAEFMNAAATEREQQKEEFAEKPGEQTETQTQSAPNVDTAPESSDTRGKLEPEPLLPPSATSEPPEAPESTASRSLPPTPADPQTKNDSSPSDAKVQQQASATPDGPAPNGSDPSVLASDTTAVSGAVSTGGLNSALATTSLVPAPAGGESIYRTIMNRLTALEANHTLYARYVEEHTGAVREMLRRVGEDLGRAEGVGKAQAQTHARTLIEWDRQRRRVDAEYQELMRRIEYLSAEVVLEKRLGIAQLLLLLAVLVFMTLTRGSRGEPVMVPSVMSRSALRAWGRRHLSLKSLSGSGDWDWVGRLKSRSRSHSPKPAAPKPKDAPDSPIKLEFPSVDEKAPAPAPPSSKPKPPRLNLHGSAARPRSRTRSIGSNTFVFDSPRARSRTPIMHTPYRRPATPTHAHAQHTPAPVPMQHSVSQGAHAPRSARRWARTAHLHELHGGRLSAARGGDGNGTGSEAPRSAGPAASVLSLGSDVFASPSPPPAPMSADLLDLGLRATGSGGGLFHEADLGRADDADSWVDTDEGSELGGEGDADVGWPERVQPVAHGIDTRIRYSLPASASRTAEKRIETAEETVQLLAEGADYNIQGGEYGRPLHAAAAGRNLVVFQLLIDAGARASISTPWTKSTALEAASEKGNLEVVTLLLSAKERAEVCARGGKLGSALQAAAQEGHLDVVRLLIGKSAALNAHDVADGDALQRASRRGHTEVVQCLIDAGANVNARCGYYGSSLQAAAKMGKPEVVKLLIDSGAEINAQEGHYGSTLQAAASGGAVKTMIFRMITETHANAPLFINKGADVNIQGGHHGTALQAAAKVGDMEVVQVLLESGADVKAEGGHYGSANDQPKSVTRRKRGRQETCTCRSEPNYSDYHPLEMQISLRMIEYMNATVQKWGVAHPEAVATLTRVLLSVRGCIMSDAEVEQFRT